MRHFPLLSCKLNDFRDEVFCSCDAQERRLGNIPCFLEMVSMCILWSKKERKVAPGCSKVTLVRWTVFGARKKCQFLQRELPSPISFKSGTIMGITQCRRLWPICFWAPLVSAYFIATPQRTWKVIGRAYR